MESLHDARRRLRRSSIATVALGVWILSSCLWHVLVATPRFHFASVSAGTLVLGHDDWFSKLVWVQFDPEHFTKAALWPQLVTPSNAKITKGSWSLHLPLWPLLLPSAIIAFRAHRTIRRLSRDVCKNCGYSRAGLAAEAACPECGQAPMPTAQ